MQATISTLGRGGRALLGRGRNAARRTASVSRWVSLAATRPAPRGAVAVSYGRPLPPPGEPARGGTVKFQRLARALPDAGARFNLLYLGSSDRPDDLRQLIWLARRRGAAFVWNQNGVAYPGWSGRRTARINAPLAHALHTADHVLYQSEFCKLSADRFLGERSDRWEILYNAVDTDEFSPAAARPGRPLTLLLGGNHYQRYRVESALRTAATIAAERPVRLLVAGSVAFTADPRAARCETVALADSLGLGDAVELTGPYAQSEAPALYRRADVLLHTKYNDPCPSTVIEAMSCGLPVVYSASGGVPELVGEDAGLGVQAPADFERDHPPNPQELAQRVLAVADRLDDYAAAARRRAVERFDLAPWIERHRTLFAELVG